MRELYGICWHPVQRKAGAVRRQEKNGRMHGHFGLAELLLVSIAFAFKFDGLNG
jgi:hypothetical protein